MTLSRRKPLFSTDEIPELLKANKIELGGAFPNYALKYRGRLNEPLNFELGYILGVFSVFPYYNALNTDEKLKTAFLTNDEKMPFDAKLGIAKTQGIVLLSSVYNTATHNAEGASEQLAGIIAGVFDYDMGNSEHGFLNPSSEVLADNCGTGGDTFPTFHVSTASAFLAAGAGVKMAKHGSPGNAMKSGSSDFITYLGIDCGIYYPPNAIEEAIDNIGFCYIEALDSRYKVIHTQTHSVAHLAHMNDIIGPMTNPVNPEKLRIKVLGTNNVTSPAVIANAYLVLNRKGITNVDKALIVKGLASNDEPTACMDEISITKAGTEAVFLHGEMVEHLRLDHDDFGFAAHVDPSDVSPPSLRKADRLKFTLDTLKRGTNEGAVNTVLANAGAVIAASRRDLDLKDGTEAARAAFESGEHWKIIKRVKDALPILGEI